jgi:hypothetical protein
MGAGGERLRTRVTNHDIQSIRSPSDLMCSILDSMNVPQVALNKLESRVKINIPAGAPLRECSVIPRLASGDNENLLATMQEQLGRDL